MKLSSIAVLLSAAIAALPGATAAEVVSLRGGNSFEDQVLVAEIANCDTQSNVDCYGGFNQCERLQTDCPQNNCIWDEGYSNDGKDCRVDDGGSTRSCSNYDNNYNKCVNKGCIYSSNGRCRAPVPCSRYSNSNACKNNGCFWTGSRCNLNCPHYDNKPDPCRKSGLCTYSSNGQCDVSNCRTLDGTSSNECENYTQGSCYWDNGSCFSNNNEEEEDMEEEAEQEE